MNTYPNVLRAIAKVPQRRFGDELLPLFTKIGKMIPNPLKTPNTDRMRLLIARLNINMF